MPEIPHPDPHEERLNEARLDQGIWNQTMADAEVTGSLEDGVPDTIADSGLGRAVQSEKSRRHNPAVPGLERGAVSGRDQSRLIANEAYEQAKADGSADQPLGPEGIAAREEAKRIARAKKHINLVTSDEFLSQPTHIQLAILRAREEQRARK